MNAYITRDAPRYVNKSVIEQVPAAYIPMIETAEIVAERYGISRDAQVPGMTSPASGLAINRFSSDCRSSSVNRSFDHFAAKVES